MILVLEVSKENSSGGASSSYKTAEVLKVKLIQGKDPC